MSHSTQLKNSQRHGQPEEHCGPMMRHTQHSPAIGRIGASRSDKLSQNNASETAL